MCSFQKYFKEMICSVGGTIFQYFLKKFRIFSFCLGGAAPQTPPVFGWRGKAPPDLPLNGRPQHLIEAAKRGSRAIKCFFFGAADDTGAADDRPKQPKTIRKKSKSMSLWNLHRTSAEPPRKLLHSN